jgi:hypothetical protein
MMNAEWNAEATKLLERRASYELNVEVGNPEFPSAFSISIAMVDS